MRCLIGLDFGIKYSGISITDPNQIIASPLDTCQTNKLIPFLRNYIENIAMRDVTQILNTKQALWL